MWNTPAIVRNPQSFYSNTQLFTISHLKQVIEQRLCYMYEQEWLSEVNTNRQCLIYRIFKKQMEFENYITLLNNRDRLILCKFRCGHFKIPSITGRFENVELHGRICTLSPRRSIGDEFHYLFEICT